MKSNVILVAVATLCLGSFGCRGSSPDLEEMVLESNGRLASAIRDAVDDTARAERACEVVDQLRRAEQDFLGDMSVARDSIEELNDDYATSRVEFDERLVYFDERRRQFKREFLEVCVELRGVLERDEWPSVFEAMQAEEASWEALLP